jgi:hypothetical protein
MIKPPLNKQSQYQLIKTGKVIVYICHCHFESTNICQLRTAIIDSSNCHVEFFLSGWFVSVKRYVCGDFSRFVVNCEIHSCPNWCFDTVRDSSTDRGTFVRIVRLNLSNKNVTRNDDAFNKFTYFYDGRPSILFLFDFGVVRSTILEDGFVVLDVCIGVIQQCLILRLGI